MLDQFSDLLIDIVNGQRDFRSRWLPYAQDASLAVDTDAGL
jgi:hypothetical protein